MSEKTAGQVYKKNIGSVVFVSTEAGGPRGSGVVVGDNEVVTNCHVVDDGSPIFVQQPEEGETPRPKEFPARIVASSARDLCLLKAEGLSAPAVEIGESKSLDVGDSVYAIGNPNGIYGTLSSGLVAQSWGNPIGTGEWAGCGIQTTAALSGGSSGGGLFDGMGRLIGITTGQMGRGESLHMALPVELVGYLQQKVDIDMQLHDDLTAALSNPSPDKFRKLADRIVESFSDPVATSFARRLMGDYEAQFGDQKAAARHAQCIRALADSQTGESRDKILVDAVQVLADMGEIESAKKLAEEIESEKLRAQAFAHIVRQLAEKSIDEARKLFEKHIPLKAISEEATPEFLEPEFLGEVASARATMEDSEEALRIADRMLRQRHDHTDSAGVAEVLARIAYALRRQNVSIGASAIFHFAGSLAVEIPDMSKKLVAVTIVAYHAALSGDHNEAMRALRTMHDIEKEAKSGGDYHSRMAWMGNAAEAQALIGDVRGAIERMKHICILGDEIVAALVCVAIMMQSKTRQE